MAFVLFFPLEFEEFSIAECVHINERQFYWEKSKFIIKSISYQSMGQSISTDPLDPLTMQQDLIKRHLPQYGGDVYLDLRNQLVHQLIKLDQQQINPQFRILINKRFNLKHPNLISVLSIEQKREQGDFCAMERIVAVKAQYRYVHHSLQNEIYRYCQMKRGIPEEEILRIFIKVVECLKYLQDHKTCHGDIKPANIFFSADGDIRLIDSYFVNGGKTSYELVLENPNSMSLLSPQQLELLKLKLFDTLVEVQKNQMFSVGLSMIEAVTVQSAMECYDLLGLRVKDEFFMRKMGEIVQYGYSQELANLIMNCVHKNKAKRPSYVQFLNAIYSIRSMLNRNQR